MSSEKMVVAGKVAGEDEVVGVTGYLFNKFFDTLNGRF